MGKYILGLKAYSNSFLYKMQYPVGLNDRWLQLLNYVCSILYALVVIKCHFHKVKINKSFKVPF